MVTVSTEMCGKLEPWTLSSFSSAMLINTQRIRSSIPFLNVAQSLNSSLFFIDFSVGEARSIRLGSREGYSEDMSAEKEKLAFALEQMAALNGVAQELAQMAEQLQGLVKRFSY